MTSPGPEQAGMRLAWPAARSCDEPSRPPACIEGTLSMTAATWPLCQGWPCGHDSVSRWYNVGKGGEATCDRLMLL